MNKTPISMNLSDIRAKDPVREMIADQIEWFKSQGGSVTIC